jgi:hypothetical protein
MTAAALAVCTHHEGKGSMSAKKKRETANPASNRNRRFQNRIWDDEGRELSRVITSSYYATDAEVQVFLKSDPRFALHYFHAQIEWLNRSTGLSYVEQMKGGDRVDIEGHQFGATLWRGAEVNTVVLFEEDH